MHGLVLLYEKDQMGIAGIGRDFIYDATLGLEFSKNIGSGETRDSSCWVTDTVYLRFWHHISLISQMGHKILKVDHI